jgi:hypothetical protein
MINILNCYVVFVAFMQDIYNYVPEIHYVSRVRTVATILRFQIYGTCNAISQDKHFVRALLFWDVMQHRLAVTNILEQPIRPIFKCQVVQKEQIIGN